MKRYFENIIKILSVLIVIVLISGCDSTKIGNYNDINKKIRALITDDENVANTVTITFNANGTSAIYN